MSSGDEDVLHGRWTHSHEEDTTNEMVFRSESHPFPRSRGRISFELHPDGTYVERSPGPVDLPEETRGRWTLKGDRLVLRADGNRPGYAWDIATVGPGRLVVKK